MDEWGQKHSIMQRYNATAKIYDMRYAEEQIIKIETALRSVKLKKHSLVLDCGCGTGLLFSYVAEKAEMIVGLDVSRKILDEARKKAKSFNNISLVLADADYTPFKNNVFSHVFAVTLLQNMPNPEKTLTEVCRIAKENAFIVVTGLKKSFSLHNFKNLLCKSELNLIRIESGDESLNCHVAVCIKS